MFFFKDVTLERLTRLQWIDAHQRTLGDTNYLIGFSIDDRVDGGDGGAIRFQIRE